MGKRSIQDRIDHDGNDVTRTNCFTKFDIVLRGRLLHTAVLNSLNQMYKIPTFTQESSQMLGQYLLPNPPAQFKLGFLRKLR